MMSDSANEEIMIDTEINMGGNREAIAELRRLAIRVYNDQAVECGDCKDCDGWCHTYGCRIIRKAMKTLYEDDVIINRLNVELARKHERIKRLEQKGSEAIRYTYDLNSEGCSKTCAHYRKEIDEHCNKNDFQCNECEISKDCMCKDCLMASHFKWNEIEDGEYR